MRSRPKLPGKSRATTLDYKGRKIKTNPKNTNEYK